MVTTTESTGLLDQFYLVLPSFNTYSLLAINQIQNVFFCKQTTKSTLSGVHKSRTTRIPFQVKRDSTLDWNLGLELQVQSRGHQVHDSIGVH